MISKNKNNFWLAYNSTILVLWASYFNMYCLICGKLLHQKLTLYSESYSSIFTHTNLENTRLFTFGITLKNWMYGAQSRSLMVCPTSQKTAIFKPFQALCSFIGNWIHFLWRITDYWSITHETAICCNPPIHNYTETKTSACCLKKKKDRQFSCEHKILTEGVFATHLASNVAI